MFSRGAFPLEKGPLFLQEDWGQTLIFNFLLLPSALSLHPISHEFSESIDIWQTLKISVHLIPIYPDVLVHQNIPKPSHGSNFLGEIYWQDLHLPQNDESFIIICWFYSLFYRDDPVGHIDTALNGDFQVSLNYIPQIRVFIKFVPGFVSKWL